MKFSRHGYWSGLPFPSSGDLPDPGIEPGSPANTDRFFTDWAIGWSPKGSPSFQTQPKNVQIVPPDLETQQVSSSSSHLCPLVLYVDFHLWGETSQLPLAHGVTHLNLAMLWLMEGRWGKTGTSVFRGLPWLFSNPTEKHGLPWWLSGKESAYNAGDVGLIPGLVRSPGEGKWLPTPVFLPGESHGQRSLAGYSPWGCKESDKAEVTDHTRTEKHRCNRVTLPFPCFPPSSCPYTKVLTYPYGQVKKTPTKMTIAS